MNLYENAEIGALITMCRERDESAFCELVRRYTPMMKKVISGFLDNPDRYDELFSEASFALHSAARTFDLGQKDVTFGLYARTCVHNRIVDLVRRESAKVDIVDVNVERIVSTSGPETALLKREMFESLLNEAANLLSDYEYKVLMLHIQGYSTAVISKQLGKSPKSVDNAKARLFTRLRSALSGVLEN
jgi:RNA polymerase sigma factor (sigma-70 family)